MTYCGGLKTNFDSEGGFLRPETVRKLERKGHSLCHCSNIGIAIQMTWESQSYVLPPSYNLGAFCLIIHRITWLMDYQCRLWATNCGGSTPRRMMWKSFSLTLLPYSLRNRPCINFTLASNHMQVSFADFWYCLDSGLKSPCCSLYTC